MKYCLRISFLLLFAFNTFLPNTSHAHGGGLDANGCHTNRKTGDYHCHRAGAADSENKFAIQRNKNQEFSCDGKTRCGQMLSCAEAMHYLRNCGLKRLDADGDGNPCETLCGNSR